MVTKYCPPKTGTPRYACCSRTVVRSCDVSTGPGQFFPSIRQGSKTKESVAALGRNTPPYLSRNVVALTTRSGSYTTHSPEKNVGVPYVPLKRTSTGTAGW